MDTSVIYLAISFAALIVVAALIFILNRKFGAGRLTPLAAIAFAFVLAGILLGADRIFGYSLIGIGVVVAAVELIVTLRKQEKAP